MALTLHPPSPVGRNDPCPCGSGRKYKRCCWAKDVASAAAEAGIPAATAAGAATGGAYTRRDRERVLARVLAFVHGKEFARDHEFAFGLLWGDPPDHVSDAEFNERLRGEDCQIAYNTWFTFDLELEPGGTPLDRFRERHGASLGAGERAYLDIVGASHVRLYEVTDVRVDEGLDLRDFTSGEVVAVRERAATHQLARWDIVAARVVAGTSGGLVVEAMPFLFPPSSATELKRTLALARREQAKGPRAGDDAFLFKTFFVFLAHCWIEGVAFRPMPTFTTTDGDSLAFVKAVFDTSDPVRLARLLRSRDDIDADGEGRFVWLEGARDHRRILGSFHLDGRRLTFEGLSEARAERARVFLAVIASEIVTYRATRVEDAMQPIKAAKSTKAPRGAGLPPEVEAQVMQEFMNKHYREWLDIPVPALGNRTPRHAARLKTQRPRLIELLKTFEIRSARDRQAGRPTYDTSWLWGALGITPE